MFHLLRDRITVDSVIFESSKVSSDHRGWTLSVSSLQASESSLDIHGDCQRETENNQGAIGTWSVSLLSN